MIPYGRQEVTKEDIESIIDVLKSDFLTQGPIVPKFEQSVSNFCGAKYSFAVNSATSALHLACLALDVGDGDEVWTAANTFVASSNCALYCGAIVDFIDIDIDTFNISIPELKKKLEISKKKNKLPKVVIPVHMAGQSCEMEEIFKLSKEYGFKIIEDASHAIGGKYKSSHVGSCKYSDITVFSFHPVKIITTGEGGMALTNNKDLAKKIEMYRTHGITRDKDLMQKIDGPWYYEQQALGFNYRMTDIQAALGLSQMTRLEKYIKTRNQIALKYDELLKDFPLKTPEVIDNIYSSFHLYVVRIELEKVSKTHKEIFENLRDLNILVNLHYIPVYLHPYYKNKLGFKSGYCPNAEKYYREAISIPMFPTLKDKELKIVVDALSKAIKE